jgi:hypothetical protein
MNRNFKLSSFFVVTSTLLFIFYFILFSNKSFSQSNSQSNLEKLNLPFSVNFSEKEQKFLNSLSPTDLEKLIKIIKLIAETNMANSKVNSFFNSNPTTQGLPGSTNSGTNGQSPTTYSNNPTPQTPYYNQSTGQYQSAPVSNSGQTSAQPQSPLSPFQQQTQQPPTPLNALLQGINQGMSDKSTSNVTCNPRNGTDAENRALFAASGIKHRVSSGFHDLPIDTALMLKELESDCNCKILVTSASRKFNQTSSNSEHGPGKRVVDLAYEPAITNYLKSKAGNGCRFTLKGIKFIDEKVCPTAAATGPHWHLNGNNWQCKK